MIRCPSGVRLAAVLLAGVAVARGAVSAGDPFARFIAPASLGADDRARVAAGAAIVAVLPAPARTLAVFGAARTAIDGARLAAWMRRPGDLQRGRYIPHIVRFSDPPRLEDLAALVLDDDDLEGLRTCRPGGCDLKLSAAEIVALRATIDRARFRGPASVLVMTRRVYGSTP